MDLVQNSDTFNDLKDKAQQMKDSVESSDTFQQAKAKASDLADQASSKLQDAADQAQGMLNGNQDESLLQVVGQEEFVDKLKDAASQAKESVENSDTFKELK